MKIAVYCGSSNGENEKYREMAEKLGTWLGEHQHILIYGGGDKGLMGAVSRTCAASCGCVVGVVPQTISLLLNRENPSVDYLYKEADMAARKKKMLYMAEAYIALPGGIGTLDEVTEILMLMRLKVFERPCIFMNVDGYYEGLQAFFKQMIEVGFMAKENFKHVLFAESLDEAENFLKAYPSLKTYAPAAFERIKDDAEEIGYLSHFATKIVREHFDPIIGKAQNDYMLEIFQSEEAITEQICKGYRYYRIMLEGVPAGFIAFYPREGKMYLSKFYTYKGLRGHHLAQQMINFVAREAKKEGLNKIYLNINRDNENSIAIYKHLGFYVLREEKNPIGQGFYMDDFVLEKAL